MITLHSAELKGDTATEQSERRAMGKANLKGAAGSQRLEKRERGRPKLVAAAELRGH